MLCSNPDCGSRRQHHEDPFTPRGHQEVEVSDQYQGKAFCSLTCACEAGYYSVVKGWIKNPRTE